ncbi:hypothetical protein [Microbacterium sp. 77mftsu3.1]|uniref:hypothetical protein n=1 Tax=Microbacterium sp. 77mftsu3.1 TaxID=1761802 RepID=UPI0003808214|nr:hypothetical protein [Microbacterium sp. 77mftsu3.1]SDH43101.1 hypothetical protein SAMN04488590_3326 [Microbacterium sp. 77mftsu3.1]
MTNALSAHLSAPDRYAATIDSATAASYLATQKPASRVRVARVDQYADAMTAGKWVAEVATLTFDEQGALVDGASVLRAIIQSDTAVTVTVATGVPIATAQYVGIGRGHSLADRIRAEFTYPELVAGIVNLELANQAGIDVVNTPRKAYVPTGTDYALANQPALEAASVRASRIISRVRGILPRHLAWVLYRATAIDAADASTFFNRLEDGVLLETGSPVLQLTQYLGRVQRPREQQRKTIGMLIKAWNLYRDGSRAKLTFKAGGAEPEDIPAIR